MSIGICDLNTSKARVLGFALLCSASLSACNSTGGAGFSFAQKGDAPVANAANSDPVVPNTSKTTLARGSVTLKAPKGFCIDQTSVSNGLQGSSAMLAECSALDGKGARDGAVMSVSISPRRGEQISAPSTDDLSKAAAPRKILQRTQKGDLALVQIASGGNDVFSPAAPVHWRGATLLDTRLVLLGLFAAEGSDLTGNKGAALLASLARGISAKRGTLLGAITPTQGKNTLDANSTQPKSVPENATPDTVEADKKAGKGFIARLLNRS